MRTTVELTEELARLARERAEREGKSLDAVVEQALRTHLGPPAPRLRPYSLRARWKVRGGGLQPGTDLENWAQLRDLMDGIE